MTDDDSGGRTHLNRRTVLQTTAALGLGTQLGVAPGSAQSAPDEIWSFETGGEIRSSPTVVDDTVYIFSESGVLYALDAETGNKEWEFVTAHKKEDSAYSSPQVVDGKVYISAESESSGCLYALDKEDGSEIWDTPFKSDSSMAGSSPTVADGTVFVASSNFEDGKNGSVYALDTETKEEVWDEPFKTGHADVQSAPTVVGGTVFIGSGDFSDSGTVYALDAETGDEVWKRDTDEGTAHGSPTVANGKVIIRTTRTLLALDTESGNKQWELFRDFRDQSSPHDDAGSGVWSTPTVSGGTAYAVLLDGSLYSIDITDGSVNWDTYLGDNALVGSSPTIADGNIYLGVGLFDPDEELPGELVALDASNGDRKWTFTPSNSVYSSPTVVDGTVYFGSQDQKVYAVDAGISGSSEGSRVNLGTLGHHHVWADEAGSGDDGDFDPTVHGFGFDNWGNFDLLSLGQILNRTADFESQMSSVGLNVTAFPPGFRTPLALLLSQAMEGWANGHCLGMTTTARDYYNNGAIPNLPDYDGGDIEMAADIVDNPEETPSLSPVEQDIDIAQSDQIFDSEYALRYIAASRAGNSDNISVDEDAVLRAIDDHLSNDRYPSIGLTDTFFTGHSVLAYHIEGKIDEDDTVYVAIYDPNEKGFFHYKPSEDSRSTLESGRYPALPFSLNDATDEYEYDGYDGFNNTLYVEPEIDADYNFFVSSETADAYKAAVQQGLGNYIAVGVSDAVGLSDDGATGELSTDSNGSIDVSVRASDGTELEPVDVPSDELRQVFGYDEAYVQFGEVDDNYEIEVSADESTTYTVEANGTRQDGGQINTDYTSSIDGGDSEVLNATIPEDDGEDGDISPGNGVITSPVDGVSDELWTAVTGDGSLTLADLGNAIQEYQNNPGNATVDGVPIDLSDLGALIQHYQDEVI